MTLAGLADEGSRRRCPAARGGRSLGTGSRRRLNTGYAVAADRVTTRAIGRTLASAGVDFHALAAAIGASRPPLPPRPSASAAAWQDFGSHFAALFGDADADADAPGARSRRSGLPIWDHGDDVGKIEPWPRVALHCLQLNRQIPKAHGGKFLSADDRERLTTVERGGRWLTNADAAWIEGIVARCHAARERWRAAERTPA